MRYLDLQQLYAYFPQLATVGPNDEGLRSIIQDAESVVLADLRNLGWDVEAISEEAYPQVRRLVLFRVLGEVLAAPISPTINPGLAQYYEQKYRMELHDVATKPDRMGRTPRLTHPHLPVVVNPPKPRRPRRF